MTRLLHGSRSLGGLFLSLGAREINSARRRLQVSSYKPLEKLELAELFDDQGLGDGILLESVSWASRLAITSS